MGKNIDILLSQTVLKKNDISCKIKQLMNSKAVEINSFKDIDYLKIFYKVPEKNTFKEREIKIVYDPSNTKVKLVLDNKDLVPSEKTFLLKNFEEEFGVPLGQTIKPELFQNGIIDLYKHILLKNIVDDLEKSSLNVFNILKSSNIIKIEEDNLWYCDNCNTFNEAKNTKCINCEYKPESIKYFSTYSIDENKIINVVKDIFKEKMPYYQFQQNINTAKYKGFTIRDEFDNEIYIILSINKLTSTDIKKLKSETKAIIFILSNQNSSTDNLIIQNDLFSYIPLEYILAYKDIGDKNFIDDYIKNACIECISKANIQSEIETIKSINVIKNSYLEYKEAQDKGDLFEDDVYNLFRYIFKTTMQLGKKTKGKRLPDGYFDIHLIQGAGVNIDKKYTLVWDAKYSDLEEGYDFSISEKRKITEYISNFNKNYEITNFSSSKILDVFIIIYNNISASKFKEIAKYIRENTDWKGKLIFFDIASLVILTEYLLQNSKSYESKKNIFNSDFMTKLLKIDNISEYNYNVIENDGVFDFVNYFNKRTPTVQTIPNLME